MKKFKPFLDTLKKSAKGFSDDQVPMMGAALAYYTMFSIAPLLIIAIGIAGVVFGESAGTDVFDAIKGMIGPQGASAIQSMVNAASSRPQAGLVATVIGFVTLLVGASGVFTQLQQSFNIIWKVATHPKAGWGPLVRQRLLSFAMVAVLGFVALVSLVVSAGLAAAGKWAAGALPGGKLLWDVVNLVVSVGVTGLMFSAVFKYLPDVELSWRDVSFGGLLTGLLFVGGKAAIGAYIGHSGVASSYGAAGSLIVILLWVYYSSQILFFGAEFTRAWATRGERKVAPKQGAVFTMPTIAAASMAEKVAEGSTNPIADRALEKSESAWYAGAIGAVALGLILVARRDRRLKLAGAIAEGAALGILAVLKGPQLMGEGEPEQEKPGIGSKILEKIPTRVKVATVAGGVGGALKSGGKEAARKIKEKVKEKVGATR